MPNTDRPNRPGRPPQLAPHLRGRTKEAATTQPDTTHPYATHHRASTELRQARCSLVEHRIVRPRLGWLRRPPRLVRRLGVAAAIVVALLVAAAPPAFAAGGPTLNGVISNLTNWIVGILAGVATLFLTIGGLRYLTAGGDPGQVEKAKTALKSAAIGYALAALAPLIVSILASVVGGS